IGVHISDNTKLFFLIALKIEINLIELTYESEGFTFGFTTHAHHFYEFHELNLYIYKLRRIDSTLGLAHNSFEGKYTCIWMAIASLGASLHRLELDQYYHLLDRLSSQHTIGIRGTTGYNMEQVVKHHWCLMFKGQPGLNGYNLITSNNIITIEMGFVQISLSKNNFQDIYKFHLFSPYAWVINFIKSIFYPQVSDTLGHFYAQFAAAYCDHRDFTMQFFIFTVTALFVRDRERIFAGHQIAGGNWGQGERIQMGRGYGIYHAEAKSETPKKFSFPFYFILQLLTLEITTQALPFPLSCSTFFPHYLATASVAINNMHLKKCCDDLKTEDLIPKALPTFGGRPEKTGRAAQLTTLYERKLNLNLHFGKAVNLHERLG
ncbi:hypothetical protein ACJX0J_040169, partial [Zea mays]